ncbi:transcriptional regulator [Actinomadura craniellae]|uniref:Transcriptional regulator n=1 Tax=Actinomadura craniellae TaxID=2231787 RepID=A0A365H2T5_9ACTN|nr:helix-turn-helix transcriptional regulator [Actinomadura craniellae]RAY12533.1 transcriptional regulator [Actinomadura craniellae]
MSASLVLRRRLAAELRALRARKGLSQDDVAEHLESSSNKIVRIENAQSSVSASDLRQLLMLFGADAETRDRLLALGRDARKRGGWWSSYRDLLPGPYVQLEAEASLVRTYQPSIVPGLLQTADYARAVVRSADSRISSDEVERRVAARGKRQERLRAEHPLALRALVDEAALRRGAGDPGTTREQMGHLIEMARLPNVSIRVLAFEAGIYPSVGWPFVILTFPEPDDPDIGYIEYRTGARCLEEAREVATCQADFGRLTRTALSEDDSVKLIERMIAEIGV